MEFETCPAYRHLQVYQLLPWEQQFRSKKTADKRIELKAAIHYHLDRGATEHEQPAQAA